MVDKISVEHYVNITVNLYPIVGLRLQMCKRERWNAVKLPPQTGAYGTQSSITHLVLKNKDILPEFLLLRECCWLKRYLLKRKNT